MSQLTVDKVRIAGISACVPRRIEENMTLSIFENEEEARKVIESTGIERRRMAEDGTTASDLSVEAVKVLLSDLDWKIESVDMLLYVCTTRDYIQPMTSPIIQNCLGMRQDSFVMDLPMGCAGWVYGMSVAGAMMQNGTLRRGLLVVAETNSRSHGFNDRTCRPLFGDAATVTALEFDDSWRKPMNFMFAVDGSGADVIMARYGGFRHPLTEESLREVEVEPGVRRRGNDIVLNGMDVFSFAIRRPGRQMKELISTFRINIEDIDFLFLHQANKYIDERIRKSLKFTVEKTPYCLSDFGNVSGASIPLTMVTRSAPALSEKMTHNLACGFGVGLQWASMEFWTQNLIVSGLVEY